MVESKTPENQAKPAKGSSTRVYVPMSLCADAIVPLSLPQAHHLRHVLRLADGTLVSLFNGSDGEWIGRLCHTDRRGASVHLREQTRPPLRLTGVYLLPAVIQRDRLERLVEKATELGVSGIEPMITDRTQPVRVNVERLSLIAEQAASQCGRLDVPVIREPVHLNTTLAAWPADRRLLAAVEVGPARAVAAAIQALIPGPVALLTGPEGGFTRRELDVFNELKFVQPVSLGDRLLKADTAALAVLAIWQALAGDWLGSERNNSAKDSQIRQYAEDPIERAQ